MAMPLSLQPRPSGAPHRLWWVLGVVGVVLAINLPILRYEWVMFDDDINILVNPHLGRGAASSFLWAFQNVDYMRRYLPLGWLGFDGLLAIDGYNPAVFHAASWVLCGLNAALAFCVFERLSRRRNAPSDEAPASFAGAAAATGALLWSVHPLRVENAAWISGLLYLGSTTLGLAAVLLYLRNEAAPRRRRAVMAALLYLGSLLFYPVLLALPALLVWRAAAESNRDRVRAAWIETRRLAGWWAAVLFAGAMNVYALATAGPQWTPPVDPSPYRWWERCADTGRACLHYATTALWPNRIAVYYGQSRFLLDDPAARIVGTLLVAILLVLLARRSTRVATLGWVGAVLITLAPFVAQMSRSFHASDRYAVLALAVCAVGIVRWLARPSPGRPPLWPFATCSVAIVAASIVYARVLPNWRNTDALQASIDRSTAGHPDVFMNYARAARALWSLGERTQADKRLADGERLFPNDPQLRETRAQLREFDARLQQRFGGPSDIPPIAVIQLDIGRTWLERGERTAALAHFTRALAVAPDYAEARQAYLSASKAR